MASQGVMYSFDPRGLFDESEALVGEDGNAEERAHMCPNKHLVSSTHAIAWRVAYIQPCSS
jgi:hypothetical protein